MLCIAKAKFKNFIFTFDTHFLTIYGIWGGIPICLGIRNR